MVGERYDENFYARDLFLNYTQEVNLYQDQYNFSPRLNYENSASILNTPVLDWSKVYFLRVVVIDTEREAEIGIGTDWPFDVIPP